MENEQGMIERGTRVGVLLLLLSSLFGSASVVLAQYPSQPQIHKDGTAVLLEDYASLPLSAHPTVRSKMDSCPWLMEKRVKSISRPSWAG